MKICILGHGLTSLVLAKALVNKGIFVDIFFSKMSKKKDKSRTIGISNSNVEFLNKNIFNIEKFSWNIKKIEIYSENFNNEKIFEFKKKDQRLFSVVNNNILISNLTSKLKKSKFIKFKKKIINYRLTNKKYNLIINCDIKNDFTKKFFTKKLSKNYNSYAYTTIIEHNKFLKNNVAIQNFTKEGPIAFLPISDTKTSVVYSIKGNKRNDIINLIKKYNLKYKIKKIHKINYFDLKLSNLRSYYYNNILAFGDLLHKIHPLAGQGFNMSIRDIKVLLKIIEFKINNGLDLDKSICYEFEKENKHKNFLFSNGVDFIYEFFNIENKFNNRILNRYIKFIVNNKFANQFFIKFADKGI